MPDQSRFLDRGVLLAHFAEKCLAVCPKCAGLLVVVSRSKFAVPFDGTNSSAICPRCAFKLTGKDGVWLGPTHGSAKKRCSNCGFKWLQQSFLRRSSTSRTRKRVQIPCPSCGHTSDVPIQWWITRLGEAFDPSFGLPLWLRTSCCGETLWAYNRQHLARLREYVAATIRQKRGFAASPSLHWSVFSRLPKWMTASANRDAVLAASIASNGPFLRISERRIRTGPSPFRKLRVAQVAKSDCSHSWRVALPKTMKIG
jgi:hypothetical protein